MIDLIRSEEEKHQEFLGKISKMLSEEIGGDSYKKVQHNDSGRRAHGSTVPHRASYRKRRVGADFLTETRRAQRTGIRLTSSDSYLFTPTALRHSSFCIQHSKLNPPVPLCLRENSRALAAD